MHLFHWCSDIYLIHQGQIEYIWSEKISFGVSLSGLRGHGTDGSPVFTLFVLVRSPLFLDGTSGTMNNTEQILANITPTVAIRRWVSTMVGPLFPLTRT